MDVRETHEYAQGHIPGAVSLPLSAIDKDPDFVGTLLPNTAAALYVHCLSGIRSARACAKLKAMGYVNTVNIGGIRSYTGPIEQ